MSRAYGYVESGLVGGIAGAAVSIVNAMASVVSKGMWLAAAAVGLGGVGLGLAGAAKAFELTTSLPFVMEWGTQVAQWGGQAAPHLASIGTVVTSGGAGATALTIMGATIPVWALPMAIAFSAALGLMVAREASHVIFGGR